MNNADMPAMPAKIKRESTNHSYIGNERQPNKIEIIDCSGLTKREHFAAMAMLGILSNPNVIDTDDDNSDWVSKRAIKQADDLLNGLAK